MSENKEITVVLTEREQEYLKEVLETQKAIYTEQEDYYQTNTALKDLNDKRSNCQSVLDKINDAQGKYDALAEELAEYAYQTIGSWSEDAQKKANISLEINDMGYGLNDTREWGLSKNNLLKVIYKAEKIYNEEYADEELDLTAGNGRGR